MLVSCTSARRNEVHALAGLEQVLFELRQLAGAEQRVTVGHSRAPPFLVTARGVRVGHEVDDGALQAGAQTAKQRETAARELHCALSVDDAQVGTKIPMRLRFEAFSAKIARSAPAANLRVVVFVLADRRGVRGHVRRRNKDFVHGAVRFLALGACGGKLLVDLAHTLFRGLGFVLFALAHERADLLGKRIALCLQGLFFRDGGLARRIQLCEAVFIPVGVARFHGSGDGVLILANETKVQHSLRSFDGNVGFWSSFQYTARKELTGPMARPHENHP